MSRYLLFGGNKKHGGYDDFIGSCKSVDATKKLLLDCGVGGNKKLPRWGHIVDITTMNRLWSLQNKEWIEDDSQPSNCSE